MINDKWQRCDNKLTSRRIIFGLYYVTPRVSNIANRCWRASLWLHVPYSQRPKVRSAKCNMSLQLVISNCFYRNRIGWSTKRDRSQRPNFWLPLTTTPLLRKQYTCDMTRRRKQFFHHLMMIFSRKILNYTNSQNLTSLFFKICRLINIS